MEELSYKNALKEKEKAGVLDIVKGLHNLRSLFLSGNAISDFFTLVE